MKALTYTQLGLAVSLLLSSITAQAALLNVGSGIPDVFTSGANLDYTFTGHCFADDGSGTSDLCGTDNGQNGNNKVTYDGALDTAASSGLLTIAGTSITVVDGENVYLSNTADHSLTANFDGNGNFVSSGSLFAINYTGDLLDQSNGQPTAPYTSGTLLTGDLTANGFGGTDGIGIIEFRFNNAGGDLSSFGSSGGIIISSISGAGWSGDWDADNSGLNFWQHSFSEAVNVNTFVPVPAAVWLFGSGILALVGIARRKRL